MKNQSGFVWQRIKLHKSFWIVIRNSLVIVFRNVISIFEYTYFNDI